MNAQLRRRLEMAARARDFLRAHQMDGVGQDLGLAKLEALLERAENLATQQRVGVAVERSAVKQRQELRRALQPRILGYLSAVGAVVGTQNAELAEQFRMPPPNTTHQGLLTMSRAILERATAPGEARDVGAGVGRAHHGARAVRGYAPGNQCRPARACRRARRSPSGCRRDQQAAPLAGQGGPVSVRG
jgi:hypothetical protein